MKYDLRLVAGLVGRLLIVVLLPSRSDAILQKQEYLDGLEESSRFLASKGIPADETAAASAISPGRSFVEYKSEREKTLESQLIAERLVRKGEVGKFSLWGRFELRKVAVVFGVARVGRYQGRGC